MKFDIKKEFRDDYPLLWKNIKDREEGTWFQCQSGEYGFLTTINEFVEKGKAVRKRAFTLFLSNKKVGTYVNPHEWGYMYFKEIPQQAIQLYTYREE